MCKCGHAMQSATTRSGLRLWVCDTCSAAVPWSSGEANPAPEAAPAIKRPWSNAKPADCDCGVRHPSRLEAAMCVDLRAQYSGPLTRGDCRIFYGVRFPLLILAPDSSGRPLYHRPDFTVVDRCGAIIAVYEAKGRESRDWVLRSRAFEGTYGIRITVRRR